MTTLPIGVAPPSVGGRVAGAPASQPSASSASFPRFERLRRLRTPWRRSGRRHCPTVLLASRPKLNADRPPRSPGMDPAAARQEEVTK